MGQFRIKIRSSWFSEDFIVFRYTTNGIFWKSIKEWEYDVERKRCYMKTKISNFKNAKYYLKRFDTLEKIKQYESEQKNKVLKHNAEIAYRNRKHKEYRKNTYKQYG